MAYNLIYQSEFDQLNDVVEKYYIKIYKKNYTGVPANVLCGGNPVIHNWGLDEPRLGVKGSNLTLKLINSGNLPLQSFFSVEDDTFLIEYFWKSQLLFTGYLVQDDCTEVQEDIDHYINLSFTDNLGLLKDVPLSSAAALLGAKTQYSKGIAAMGEKKFSVYYAPFTVEIGNTIIISNSGSPRDGQYTVVNVVPTGTSIEITTNEIVNPWIGVENADLTVIVPVDLTERYPLLEFMRLCLLSTNLQLNTDVYANINPIGGGINQRMFEDVYLSGDTFLSSDSYASCYDVLNTILTRFKATIFQAYGIWNVVRWDQLRYEDSFIESSRYNPEWVYQSQGGQLNTFTYGNGSDIQNGIQESILRPFKFDRETFNYRQPAFLKNAALQNLGAFISTETVGDIRTDKYEFPASSKWLHIYGDTAHIVVVTEILAFSEVEKERYVYQNKIAAGPNIAHVMFNDIEVNQGDGLEFSLSIKCASGTSGDAVIYRVGVSVQTGVGAYYNLVNGLGYFSWNAGIAAGSQISATSTAAEAQDYFSFTLSEFGTQKRIPRIPADGILKIYIYGTNDTNVSQPNVDAIWKDLNLTIVNYVNDSTTVIGHVHYQYQPPTINNSSDIDIQIDSSPLNTIAGTLFLESFTNLLQNRTDMWNRAGITELQRLGSITTFEENFWRRTARSKLEGALLEIIRPGAYRYTGLMTFGGTPDDQGNYPITIPGLSTNMDIGDSFTITGSALNDGTYTIVLYTGGGSFIYVTTPLTTEVSVVATITISTKVHLSLLTVIKYLPKSTLNYIFGMLSIEYKEIIARGTMWEIYKDGEVDSDFTRNYDFKYLYNTK